MAHPEVLEERPITLSELKAALAAIQDRDEELSFRAGKTVDHLNHLSISDDAQRAALVEKLEALSVPRLKIQHINKIIDLMPKSVKELNVILSGYTLTVNKDYQQQIVDAINA